MVTKDNYPQMCCLKSTLKKQANKTPIMKIIAFLSFKNIQSLLWGTTITVEITISKLLAVWLFKTQISRLVWQAFWKADYQQNWSSATEKKLKIIFY